MKDREISREASKFALFWVHFLPSWTCPRLHNLLRGTSNKNKLDRPNITSKITNRPEKQNEWKWFIFICSYCWSTPWDKRGRLLRLGQALEPGRGDQRKWQRERNHKYLSLPGLSCKLKHSNENGKEVMICNDITCAWDWTQVCHTYPA